MNVINLNWLAGLHDRSKQPRKPSRAAIRVHALKLAAERDKISADDPRLEVDAITGAVRDVIESEEAVYERKLRICYAVIAILAIALVGALTFIAIIVH